MRNIQYHDRYYLENILPKLHVYDYYKKFYFVGNLLAKFTQKS